MKTLPSKDEIRQWISHNPGLAAKRDIAKAFGIKGGAARIELNAPRTLIARTRSNSSTVVSRSGVTTACSPRFAPVTVRSGSAMEYTRLSLPWCVRGITKGCAASMT